MSRQKIFGFFKTSCLWKKACFFSLSAHHLSLPAAAKKKAFLKLEMQKNKKIELQIECHKPSKKFTNFKEKYKKNISLKKKIYLKNCCFFKHLLILLTFLAWKLSTHFAIKEMIMCKKKLSPLIWIFCSFRKKKYFPTLQISFNIWLIKNSMSFNNGFWVILFCVSAKLTPLIIAK